MFYIMYVEGDESYMVVVKADSLIWAEKMAGVEDVPHKVCILSTADVLTLQGNKEVLIRF